MSCFICRDASYILCCLNNRIASKGPGVINRFEEGKLNGEGAWRTPVVQLDIRCRGRPLGASVYGGDGGHCYTWL